MDGPNDANSGVPLYTPISKLYIWLSQVSLSRAEWFEMQASYRVAVQAVAGESSPPVSSMFNDTSGGNLVYSTDVSPIGTCFTRHFEELGFPYMYEISFCNGKSFHF